MRVSIELVRSSEASNPAASRVTLAFDVQAVINDDPITTERTKTPLECRRLQGDIKDMVNKLMLRFVRIGGVSLRLDLSDVPTRLSAIFEVNDDEHYDSVHELLQELVQQVMPPVKDDAQAESKTLARPVATVAVGSVL